MSQKKSNTVCGPFCKSQTRFSPRCIWYNLPCLPPLWAEATPPLNRKQGRNWDRGESGDNTSLSVLAQDLRYYFLFAFLLPGIFPAFSTFLSPPGRPFLIIKKSAAKKVEKVMKEFYILAVSDLNLRKCCIFVRYFYLKTRA